MPTTDERAPRRPAGPSTGPAVAEGDADIRVSGAGGAVARPAEPSPGDGAKAPATGPAASGRVSMAQVAALARVSGQTVSRVVNDSPRVDPGTRARVEAAMRELGYRPHRAARALRTGRTGVIGLVVTTLATVGNSRMLQDVVEQAAERGYGVTVATVTGGAGVAGAFDRLHDQGVDGAIVLNEASALAHDLAEPFGVPVVIVDAPPGTRGATVSSDHRAGARAAVEHLIGLGHRRIAHLAGPCGSFAASEREAGWRDALAAAGVPSTEADAPRGGAGARAARPERDAARAVVRGDWSAESGHEAAAALAGASAVFSANDQMALGLIRGLAERGIAVPRDVSVVGFDDVPEAANYLPPLTTVRQDFPALAARAVQALVSGIGGATGARNVSVDAPLVIRASTAGPSR